MKLGKRQLEWIEYLEQAPPKQKCEGELGYKVTISKEFTFKACCLGAACYLLHGDDVFKNNGAINSVYIKGQVIRDKNYLCLTMGDWNTYGLNSGEGEFCDKAFKLNLGNILKLEHITFKDLFPNRRFKNIQKESLKACRSLASLNDSNLLSWKEIAHVMRTLSKFIFSSSK